MITLELTPDEREFLQALLEDPFSYGEDAQRGLCHRWEEIREDLLNRVEQLVKP